MGGHPVSFVDSSEARRRGIEADFQDLALADKQPVYMDLYLGRDLALPLTGLLDRERMIRGSEEPVRELDANLPA